MIVARRVYLYAIALIALGVLVSGLAGLLEVGFETLVEALAPPVATVGRPDLRGRVSFSGALTAAGLLVWLVHWWLAERPIRTGGPTAAAERGAALRRLYLYAVLLIGGLIVTFALGTLLTDLLTALFVRLSVVEVIAGRVVSPLALLATTGALWLYHARVATVDRALAPEEGASATLRRWFAYGLAFVGLMVLLSGASGLIRALWEEIARPTAAGVLGADFFAAQVANRVAWIATGLVVWLAAWRWSTGFLARANVDPESRSVLRKVYLYLVLAVAVAWTVWNLGQILYGLLRLALLGGRVEGGAGSIWHDLGSPAAAALVFGVAWLYHVRVVQREAALAPELREQATIRWLYEYLAALVGLSAVGFGIGGTLATVLDLAAQPGAIRPTNWWEDRISLFATLAVVGLPLWLAYWTRLQREAPTPLARGSVVRRIYLLVAFALSVLTLLSSGVFALYQVMRLALGERWTAAQTTDLTTAASAAAVAGLLLAYHLGVFRRDAAAIPAVAPAVPGEPVLAVALIRAADRDAWLAFQRTLGRTPSSSVEVDLREIGTDDQEKIRALLPAEPSA
jgi:hypothetical protein